MPSIITRGAMSAQGFGFGASSASVPSYAMAYFTDDTNKTIKIYTTADSGETWSLSYSNPSSLTGGEVYGIGSQNNNYYFEPYFSGKPFVMTSTGTVSVKAAKSLSMFVPVPSSTVVLGADGSVVYKSTDSGSTYGASPVYTGGIFLTTLLYGNGVFFISHVDTSVSPYGQKHYYSTDLGGSWTQVTSPLPATANGISGNGCFANGYFHVWFPNLDTTGGWLYAKSTNGSSWSTPTVLTGVSQPGVGNYGNIPGVAYANSRFYSTNNTYGLIQSTDGINWTQVLAPPSGKYVVSCCAVSNGIIATYVDSSNTGTSATIAKTPFASPSWTTKQTVSFGGSTMVAIPSYNALYGLNSG